MTHQSVFISIEGPEGAGKTSLINALAPELRQNLKRSVLTTREPGGNPIAEGIRNMLAADTSVNMDARTEALLFAAARRQHLVETILPALARNEIVLSDRYIDSSLAYQGGGRQLGVDDVLVLNEFAINHVLPDLTLYLDLPVEIGLERINQQRQNKIDRLDREKLDFHQRVRKTYLNLLERFPDRIVKIDANQPLDHVIQAAQVELNKILEVKS
ncbi:dTMP kinase [Convivina praedatoris]|uniref:Thymidylate kinase n=1 Tax=Convivina praedatoris TaxID=2880963 RepID=A0ABN8H7Z9_9LACO|nr:dTMP kinase [Convivina sp. LMG 32447]CAH1851652.1 Thymidylate kinase [Convivina sp. LMG 32447]CAH1851675.1 Thymidylate kinase [Convivina sp. LMG 32447]CAH1853163.1 Thymidylate kinase [Convivina sp. LMG 32447]